MLHCYIVPLCLECTKTKRFSGALANYKCRICGCRSGNRRIIYSGNLDIAPIAAHEACIDDISAKIFRPPFDPKWHQIDNLY